LRRKFLWISWIRGLIETNLIGVSYRVQGSWENIPVPVAALSIMAGLVACGFFGIKYWILFALGLLFLLFVTYAHIRALCVSDDSLVRMTLVKKILKMKSWWILRERNAEIRKLIIENLGWPKILSDLQGRLVDEWKEYELYRIQPKDRLMREPFYLLKMKCPSTGSDYTLCVPPYFRKAKEAITWIRRDIAPEEFIQQT